LVDGVRILGTTLWSNIPENLQLEVEMHLSDFRVIRMSETKGDTLRAPGTKNSKNKINFQVYVKWFEEEYSWLKEEIEKAKINKEKVVVLTYFYCKSFQIHFLAIMRLSLTVDLAILLTLLLLQIMHFALISETSSDHQWRCGRMDILIGSMI
jgi:hypothetical protein